MGRRLGCNRGAVAGPYLCGTTIGLELWLPHTAGVQYGNGKRKYKVSDVKPKRTLTGRVVLPDGIQIPVVWKQRLLPKRQSPNHPNEQ